VAPTTVRSNKISRSGPPRDVAERGQFMSFQKQPHLVIADPSLAKSISFTYHSQAREHMKSGSSACQAQKKKKKKPS